MEIFNNDVTVLGELTLSLTNATGNILTIDGTGIARFRTPSQVLEDIGGATAAQGDNADTAFGWGDHASEGYLTAEIDTLDSVTTKGAITTNDITIGSLIADDVSTDYIDVKTTPPAPAWKEGRIFYDSVNKCFTSYDDVSSVSLQVGQETRVRVYNDTGSTILNGQAVTVVGVNTLDDVPKVDLAIASNETSALNTIGVATHDIPTGTYGWATTSGLIHDIDTSDYTEGSSIWLSETVAGAYQLTRPASPNWEVRIGNIIKQDAVNGHIYTELRAISNDHDNNKFYNGSILEDHTVTITTTPTVTTINVIEVGSRGFLSVILNEKYTKVFEPINIALVNGTDTAPQENFVYINDLGVITVSTSGFPTAQQYAPIATAMVQSAASANTYGVYKLHAWNDELASTSGQGHLSHINKWIRNRPSTWESGVVLTTVEGVTQPTIPIAYSSGFVYQLHPHVFPAFNTATGSDLYEINNPTTPYVRRSSISPAIDTDSLGNPIGNNKYYKLVIWGTISDEEAQCKVMFNLPSGSYVNVTDALNDIDKTANFTIPKEYLGAGFLITSMIIQRGTTNVQIVTDSIEDLRGQFPVSGSGGGTTGGAGITAWTELSDTPLSITADGIVVGNNAGSALEFLTPNSAFNKNFGTIAGTIAQGNDSRILNGQTAFSWGDHAGLYASASQGSLADGSLQRTGGTITGDIVVGSSDRDNGMFGTYDVTKTQHIWSMGVAYRNSANGDDFGNIYGLSYKHTSNTTGGTMAGGHQVVFSANGVPNASMGQNGFWAAGGFYKNNSSNNHILLGSGSHKLVSDFSTAAQGVLADNSVQLTGEVSQTIDSSLIIEKTFVSNQILFSVGSSNRFLRILDRFADNSGSPFEIITNNAINIVIDSLVAVAIDSVGNVGIGTTNPAEKLEINGNVKFSTGAIIDSTTQLGAAQNDLTISAPDYIRLSAGGIEMNGPIRATTTQPNLIFKTSSGVENARILANGNVGIGTTTPLNKLHVNGGDIRITDTFPSLILDGTTGGNVWSFIEVTSGNLEIRVNNLQKFFIDASGNTQINGNVKAKGAIIGDNATVYDLIVESSSPAIRLSDTSAGTTHDIISNNAELRLSGSAFISLFAAGTNRMTVNSTGATVVGNVNATSLIINTGQSLKWGTGATRISGIDGSNITITPNNIESVKFNANGNTGFGVTAIATERVEVNGNVKATGFIGSGSQLTGVATTAQGVLADSALQPNGNGSGLTNVNAATLSNRSVTQFAYAKDVISTDLNAVLQPGMYRVNNNTPNAPTTTFYVLTVSGNGGNVTSQTATQFQDGTTYIRAYNTSWSAWERVAFVNDVASSAQGVLADNSVQLTGETSQTIEGNIGLGVTPIEKLVLKYGNKFGFTFSDANQGGLTYITKPATGNSPLTFGAIFAPPPTNLIFNFVRNTSASVLSILQSGNVGIGTETPTQKLEVNGNANFKGFASVGNGQNLVSTEGIRFSRTLDSARYQSIFTTSSSIAALNLMQFMVHNAAGAATQVTAMTLTGEGNVGIGTITPTEKLEVNGNVKANSFLSDVITAISDILLTSSNSDLIVDSSFGSVAVTLPLLSSVSAGKKYTIIAYDATNTITLETSGSEQIRQVKTDTTTSTILAAGDIYTVVNAGSYWQIISKQ
jgi:hypothetical protein